MIRVVKDWEECVSLFLQEAIEAPHMEPEVCERLLEYIEYLVQMDREAYRRRVLEKVRSVFDGEKSLEALTLVVGGVEHG